MYNTFKEEKGKKTWYSLAERFPGLLWETSPNAKTAFLEEVLQVSGFPSPPPGETWLRPLHWEDSAGSAPDSTLPAALCMAQALRVQEVFTKLEQTQQNAKQAKGTPCFHSGTKS